MLSDHSSPSPLNSPQEATTVAAFSPLFSIGASLTLVGVAGTMAGLTMGLLGIDPIELEVAKEAGGTPEQAKQAKAVWTVVKQHHKLLVTLLLCNAMANEALPLFLDKLVPPLCAILLSVTLVLVFGEIIPSAIFTGPKQLELAARMVPIVRLLMLVSTPISWPIAKLLDLVLGEGHAATRFNRRQIRTLINLHLQSKHRQHAHVSGAVNFKSSHNPGPGLSEDEVTIVGETLKLASKTVGGIMTPLEEVCMLPEDTCFDENTLADVLGYGHSRIPVFRGRRENIVGLLMVRNLIVLNPNECRPLKGMHLRHPLALHPSVGLLETLNEFQVGKSHMAIVTPQAEEVMRAWANGHDLPSSVRILGIITAEDVLEELIGEEIHDEKDYADHLLATDADLEKPQGEAIASGDPTGESGSSVGGHLEREKMKIACVKRATRKFKLLAERSRRRRLLHTPRARSHSQHESLFDQRRAASVDDEENARLLGP